MSFSYQYFQNEVINSLHASQFSHHFVTCEFSLKLTLSECQTFWIKIRPDILLGLGWVQTVCKGYQQTTKLPLARKESNKDINSACLAIFKLFCHLSIFFKIKIFRKLFQKYHQSQSVWIQIRPDILSGLIWFQALCTGLKQTTLTGKEF